MDQIKIGLFLKELRNGRNLTQEALAERLSVSRRTVSRWETGSNLPDLDLLIELSDFYQVELRDLLAGERRSEIRDGDRETALLLKDFTREESAKLTRRMHGAFLLGLLCFGVNFALECANVRSAATEFIRGGSFGLAFSTMLLGAFLTGKHAGKILALKKRLFKWKR